MFGSFHVGIMGTGKIAGVMADTIKRMKNVKVYAVASRQQIRADAFADRYSCKKAYGSYEELVKDSKVDLVYVATPHSEHFENVKLCLHAGKPVLCEKAFTVNASQAQELITLAKEKQVFLAEAMWVRYMPMLTTIREVIGSGVIGEPKALTANLGYEISGKERLIKPELAGGALLDVGIYPLNFALMVFGHNISKIVSGCTFTETGVDEQNSISLQYYDGKVANLCSSMVAISDRKGIIYGTKGFAIVENINNFESITIYDEEYRKGTTYKCPKQISGYEYEIEACISAIKNKQLECELMPHSETLRVMRLMDAIREQWGLRYPCEQEEQTIKSEQEQGQESEQETIQEKAQEPIQKPIQEESVVEEKNVAAAAELGTDTKEVGENAVVEE